MLFSTDRCILPYGETGQKIPGFYASRNWSSRHLLINVDEWRNMRIISAYEIMLASRARVPTLEFEPE